MYDSRLFRSDRTSTTVGQFDLPASAPNFSQTGPIRRHIVVFPATSVTITHDGGRPVVTDSNTVMFYNRHQEYRRDRISSEGDHCHWYHVDEEAFGDAVTPFDPAVEERPGRPFTFDHGPCSADLFLTHRLLLEYLESTSEPDPLRVEEAVLGNVQRAVARAHAGRGVPAASLHERHHEIVEVAKAVMAVHYDQPLTLERIAGAAGVSQFQLCRLFKKRTGNTVHRYLTHLRLRHALRRLPDFAGRLGALAGDLGFSNHSHFTHAFRQAFGCAPSRLGSKLSRRRLTELETMLDTPVTAH